MAERIRKDPRASAKLDAIRQHARSYIYGDSSLIAEAKPVIEQYFSLFEVPLWAFPNVTVKSGATLMFGPGANVLLAATWR